jgi:hypothetical protein
MTAYGFVGWTECWENEQILPFVNRTLRRAYDTTCN